MPCCSYVYSFFYKPKEVVTEETPLFENHDERDEGIGSVTPEIIKCEIKSFVQICYVANTGFVSWYSYIPQGKYSHIRSLQCCKSDLQSNQAMLDFAIRKGYKAPQWSLNIVTSQNGTKIIEAEKVRHIK